MLLVLHLLLKVILFHLFLEILALDQMLFIQLLQQELIAIASKEPIVAYLVIAITVKLDCCFTSFTIALVVIVKQIIAIAIA